MNIQHFEKNFHYNDQELLLVAKKIGKMATICKRVKDEASVIRVDVEKRETKKERDQLKITVTVELPGKVMRAESRRPDVVEGVDRCIEKIQPQLVKYKEMHTAKGKAQKARKRAVAA